MSATLSICSRCSSQIEPGELRCPVCYLTAPEIFATAGTPLQTPIFRCHQCGVALEHQPDKKDLHCCFCNGPLSHEIVNNPLEQPTEFLLFTVNPEEAVQAYLQWLEDLGPFRPTRLASKTRLASIHPVWWVGWAFKADVMVSWTADSDAGTRNAPWAPHAGDQLVQFEDIVVPASKGLTRDECAQLAPTYAPGSGVERSKAGNTSTPLEHLELPCSLARQRILSTIQSLAKHKVKNGAIPGTKFRNIHTSIHLRGLAARRLAFPAYILSYQYHGKAYRTVISGQEPSCVIGKAPRSFTKIILAAIAATAGLVSLATALWLR